MKHCTCDRCGKYFEPDDHNSGLLSQRVQNSEHSSWTCPLHLDLCPICMKEFEDVFMKVASLSKVTL